MKNNNDSTHVLRGLLPPPSMATQQYSLRRHPHDRQMPDHTGHLADKNSLIRVLYKDCYWLFLYCNSVLSVSICVLSYVNKQMIDWLIDWNKFTSLSPYVYDHSSANLTALNKQKICMQNDSKSRHISKMQVCTDLDVVMGKSPNPNPNPHHACPHFTRCPPPHILHSRPQ